MEDLIPTGQFAGASQQPDQPRRAQLLEPVEAGPGVRVLTDDVAGWAKQSGRELAGPPREIYLSDPSREELRMEIAWPIR